MIFGEQGTPGLLCQTGFNRRKPPCKCRRPGAAGIIDVRRLQYVDAVTNLDPHVNHRDSID